MRAGCFSNRGIVFVLSAAAALVLALTTGAGVGAASGVPRGGPSPNVLCTCDDGGGYYIDPFYAASGITGQRTDMGVDFDGFGQISAMGDGTIWWSSASSSGWYGPYIWYKLSDGPQAGHYVYVAEGVTVNPNLTEGQHVTAGQKIATFVPYSSTGIETGWATSEANLNLYHQQCGAYNGEGETHIGDSFARFLLSVGRTPLETPPNPYSGPLYTIECGYSDLYG